jgi:lysophospholipase L1-like esterase
MSELATRIGIPATAIIVESASTTTRENAELSAPLLQARRFRRLLLVTDRLHMPRAEGVFRNLGFDVLRASVPIYEGHINNTDMLAAGLREYIALAYYRTRGWLDSREPHAAQAVVPALSDSEVEGSTGVTIPISNPDGPIVVLGASYAGGWKMAAVGARPVINKGVAGQQSFEMLERFERDVVAARPRAVVLWGFINDIFRAPGGRIEDVLPRVRDSYLAMIALSRRYGIEPVLATEVTVRPNDGALETLAGWIGRLRGKESYQDRINRYVMENNRWIVDLARREDLLLLDLQAALAEPGGRRRRQFTAADGSHITPAGYDALTTFAQPILERHFGSH